MIHLACKKLRTSSLYTVYFKIILAVFALVLSPLSCLNILGYGVVLWGDPDAQNMQGLSNGDIIAISGESRVSNSYIFSRDGKEYSISISRIAFFRHRPRAEEYRQQFVQFEDWYAVNMNSGGLVMRSAPDHKAQQVYRLRPRQTIKILDQASDSMTLGNLEGRWYEVLTEDGVRGFVFDHHLRLENRSKPSSEQVIKLAALEQSRDELDIGFDSLKGIWYEKKYAQFLRSGRMIDLRLLMLSGNEGHFKGQFYVNTRTKQIELYLQPSQEPTEVIPYGLDSITIDDSAEIGFNERQARAIFVKADEISFYYHAKNGEEVIIGLQKIGKGELKNYQKQALAQRKVALSTIFEKGSQFSAAERYGSIQFQADGRFSWSNTSALVADGFLRRGPTKGILFFPYQMGVGLRDDYDQLLTFAFEDGQELSFLLKINYEDQLLLRYVSPFMIDSTGTLNSDTFTEKLDIHMHLEGKPLIPVDLF